MIWDDLGFLLTKNRYNENSIIVEIFTKNHGKAPGIIFGGTSKKIKNYLQIGNQLFVNYNSKSENRSGFFKIEIQKAYSAQYFDHPNKLNCLSSAMNLIKLLTAEFQSNTGIYDLINEFYAILSDKEWLKKYIFWELKLLSVLGYNLDFESIVNKKIIDNKTLYIAESSTEKRIVPNFFIDKKVTVNDLNTLLEGLKLVGDYMNKTILKPNNINYPISRYQFVNSLKQLN